jgi:hypothetical protein
MCRVPAQAVFAIVGGTTGEADAIAYEIVQGIVVHGLTLLKKVS